jgi:hypothetical protein
MITYIFHGGGFARDANIVPYIVEQAHNTGTVLFLYHARVEERWEALFDVDAKSLSEASGRGMDAVLGSSDPTECLSQIMSADVVVIRGGSTIMLKEFFVQMPGLMSALDGKIVFGSSAGANVFATAYYSNDAGCVREGMGILPINLYCHYDDTKASNLEELTTINDFPTYTLGECERMVMPV